MQVYKKYIKEYDDFPIEGIKYYDLNPLYKDGQLRTRLVEDCVSVCRNINVNQRPLWHSEFDYIGVVESRGYIIGSMLAHELNKGLVLLRSKPNRLPGETSVVKHTLEYGDAQMECQKGEGRVLIVDDVIATGGTINGAIEVLTKAGYTPVSALFLAELTQFNPNIDIPFASIIKY
tara:strand:+ start:1103 stop:1630 length:528 start_codon:yes stop_codon:yes gene_type:complete